MTALVGRHICRIDKKGRVSIPKSFREVFSTKISEDVYVYPSFKYYALEACGEDFISQVVSSLNTLDVFSDDQDDVASTILENSVKLKYDSDYKDGAKLIVELHEDFGIDPKSDLAKDQVKMVYGLKGRAINKAVKQALIDISNSKKAGTKWKVWTASELKQKQRNAENEDTLARTMSSGLYKSSDILADFYKDNEMGNEKAQFRSKLKLIIHHPDPDAKDDFESNWSAWKKQLQFWLEPHGFSVDKVELDHEVEDTTGYDD